MYVWWREAVVCTSQLLLGEREWGEDQLLLDHGGVGWWKGWVIMTYMIVVVYLARAAQCSYSQRQGVLVPSPLTYNETREREKEIVSISGGRCTADRADYQHSQQSVVRGLSWSEGASVCTCCTSSLQSSSSTRLQGSTPASEHHKVKNFLFPF